YCSDCLAKDRPYAPGDRSWPRPALPQFDDDHIVTGRCPTHTGRSRRDRPQTARQPTRSRGFPYWRDPTRSCRSGRRKPAAREFAVSGQSEDRNQSHYDLFEGHFICLLDLPLFVDRFPRPVEGKLGGVRCGSRGDPPVHWSGIASMSQIYTSLGGIPLVRFATETCVAPTTASTVAFTRLRTCQERTLF